jgi:glycosyltransferase involved in cell wall biosynthesis
MIDKCLYDFSFVVPAFNEESHLGHTLIALDKCMERAKGYRGEIVVVDNNSNDRTAEIAKARGAKVVFEPHNQISRARNHGATQSRGENLFFVDADTLVSPDLFLDALELLKGGSCGAGGSLLSFDQKDGRWFWGGLIPSFWNRISAMVRLAAGSFLFCRRDFFFECRGFSEKIYAGEEIFFSRKLKKLCKRESKDFVILKNNPVITSSRKLNWFSNWQLLCSMIIVICVPFAIRSRRLCSFWYRRPS